MKRKNCWSYWFLLEIFNSKKTEKTKFFEYFLYSISELSEKEAVILRNNLEFLEVPYEVFLEHLLCSLGNARLSLPDYLNNSLDIDDYKKIAANVEKIQQLRRKLKKCVFNIVERIRLKNEISCLTKKIMTIEQVLNYFFLRMADEENVKIKDLNSFVIGLKEEFCSFAQDFPNNSKHLSL